MIFWILCMARWFVYQSVYIHNMLTTLMVVRILTDGLLLVLLASCPWTWLYPEYVETLLTSVDTVYKSLFYTIVLLICFVFYVHRPCHRDTARSPTD